MKRLGKIVLKNVAANVLRGTATAAVALALPHFLTRALSPDRFGAWSLMLQVAACASYLDFGLQTAVARHVAQLIEGGEERRIGQLASTALAMLTAAGGLALTAIGILLWQLPVFFRGIPASLFLEFRLAASLLAASSCAQLPLSTYTGILIGRHRNEYPALAIGGSRLAGGAAAIAAAFLGYSLIAIAACIAVANLLGSLLQAAFAYRIQPALRIRLHAFDGRLAARLARYCAGLTVWSFGVFLVNGMDLVVVGHFHFSAVGCYSIATALIACLIGFNFAIVNALLAPIAALHARGELFRIRSSVLLATRWVLAVNIALTALVFVFGESALTFWVGGAYAQPAFSILRILVVAQAVRSIGGAFCVMLMATGQQHLGIEGAIVEGIVSLGASLLGAVAFGPAGVAAGTLAGTLCGLLWILARTMPRAQAVPIARREYLVEGVLLPIAACSPIVVCAFLGNRASGQSNAWVWSLALAGTASLLLRFGRLGSMRPQNPL